MVCIFTWFDDPGFFTHLSVLQFELLILGVFHLLDMVGDGQRKKGVLADCVIVVAHVEKECLFVGEVEVVFKFIVGANWVAV